MLISGKRIRKLDHHLRGVPRGKIVVIAKLDVQLETERVQEIGFDALEDGSSVLPAIVGPITRYNAEGRELVHKELPMETAYRQIEWHWAEWHGEDRVERSDIRDVPYERYPRTFVPPPSVEATLVNQDGLGWVLTTPATSYTDANESVLMHHINLLLELFGECSVLTDNLNPYLRATRRLNWIVLPAGEIPWPRLKARIEDDLKRLPPGNAVVLELRLKMLSERYKPDFVAQGRAGFRGYLVFGFQRKGTYIVESFEYGNATYVFGNDWERLSQMTKKEVLDENHQAHRFVHREGWGGKIRQLLA